MKILILGESGTGKSHSIKSLNPKETFIIKSINKPLPWKGSNKDYNENNTVITRNAKKIIETIRKVKESKFTNLIVDDFQYIMGIEFMERANEEGWSKFSDINTKVYFILKELSILANTHNVIILSHTEMYKDSKDNVRYKIKTIGKMLDQHITIEGLFDTVLYTGIKVTPEGKSYCFVTNSDGNDTCKSPEDMFEEYIPNDLKYVINTYNEYYN